MPNATGEPSPGTQERTTDELLSSVLGGNREHYHEEQECQRSAPQSEEQCAWETGLLALQPTDPLTAVQELENGTDTKSKKLWALR